VKTSKKVKVISAVTAFSLIICLILSGCNNMSNGGNKSDEANKLNQSSANETDQAPQPSEETERPEKPSPSKPSPDPTKPPAVKPEAPETSSKPETSTKPDSDKEKPGDVPAGDLSIVKVATGWSHSMALHADGSLWVWGDNAFGQLGNGKATIFDAHCQIVENHDEYIPVRLLDNIMDIAAGSGFSLAVNNKGELFSWGSYIAQPAGGSRINQTTPLKIMDDVVSVDACGSTAIAITGDGRLWAWGIDVTSLWSWDPSTGDKTYITDKVLIAENVQKAAAGGGHILYLMGDGNLFGIGNASNLGIGSVAPNTYISKPTLIFSSVRDIAANYQTSFAITIDDRLFGWGPNADSGYVGSGSSEFWIDAPEFVMDDVQAVFPGNMLLRNDNSLWIWADINAGFDFWFTTPDKQGADGGGMMLDLIVRYGKIPVKIMSNVLTAHGGARHILAVDRDLNLYAWGDNQFGQLGTGKVNTYGYETDEFYGDTFYMTEDNCEPEPVRIGSVAAVTR